MEIRPVHATTGPVPAQDGRPPLTEVVLSLAFNPLSGLDLVTLVELWQAQYRPEFPHVEEQPPYQMPIETFDGLPSVASFSFQIAPVPLTPRLWFIDESRRDLVQVQRGWFARNWRKSEDEGNYPRYPHMREGFATALTSLEAFVRERELGVVQPTQLEMSYVNHIDNGVAGGTVGLDQILSVLDLSRMADFGQPETQRLGLDYPLTHAGEQVARLHITANPAVRKTGLQPVVELNITVRGRPLDDSREGVLGFFDLAAARSLAAFQAITNPALHPTWGLE